ncbi:MAG: EamA family transporter [Halobacteriales archaeon]|nr:EamA family transporter [Halobacteriales archaeon]
MFGVLLAVAAAFTIALQAVFIRLGTDKGNSRGVLVVVLATNIAVLVPIAFVVGYPRPYYGLTPLSFGAFVGAGIVGTLFGRSLFYESIERVGASRAEPVKASQPLHAAAVAVVVLGEALTAVHLLGILLIVAGVGFVSWTIRDGGTAPPRTLLLPLAAAFFFGVEPVFASIGLSEGTPVVVGLAVKTAAASAGFAVYLRWKDTLDTTAFRSPSRRWYLLAAAANVAFLILYYTALTVSDVVVVVPIVQTSPLFVVVLSALFLRDLEKVDARVFAGALLVVIGAAIVTATGVTP